jgi:RNase H-fold protein (predicted Holliday junction resolvase)
MTKILAIDPGMFKCGVVIADINQRIVLEALVIKSNNLLSYAEKISKKEDKLKFIIGNGTSSQRYISELKELNSNLVIADETNSTYRAKQRYFEIFPLKGLKNFLPKEIFILNKNLDALAALVIMEDHFNFKFEISELISVKTWLK